MITFSDQFLEELRSRLNPSDVLGKHMVLQPKGRGEFVGLCPFHKEKTPSFTVSDAKGFYHCFGCGKHGDVIRFLTDNQGLTFPDAVERLAREAGMEMPKISAQEAKQQEKRNSLIDLTEAAATWFEEQLRTNAGKEALEYLKKRSIPEAVIRTFRLGFSPDSRNGLLEAMKAKGFEEKQLEDTGLIIRHEGKAPYDRFRGRVMFPIGDTRGNVIAFGGRILGEGEPKYLNSPETALFHKSNVLYGWHLAKDRAFKRRNIVAVEGYMDVIALHMAGITNAVAPLGTALTENHLRMMWKPSPEPVICMDGDNAGKRAMKRAAENYLSALKPGYSMKFTMLPKGEDPDDVIKNHGIDTMRQLLTRARPLSEVLFEMEWEEASPETPEQRAAFERNMIKLAYKIEDDTVKQYYKDYFLSRINRITREARFDKRKPKQVFTPPDANIRYLHTEPAERYEVIAIKLLLQHPELLENFEKETDLEHFILKNNSLSILRDHILTAHHSNDALNAENLRAYLETMGLRDHITFVEEYKFLESFATHGQNKALAENEWQLVIAQYTLVKLEEELQEVTRRYQGDVSEENQNYQLALQEQIREGIKKVEKEKLNYDKIMDF
jgi:DNA primase